MRSRSSWCDFATILLLLVGLLSGCGLHRVERTLVDPSKAATLDANSPTLKAHLRSGAVYILDRWRAESGGTVIVGQGRLLGADRTVISTGDYRLPTDSVALFETNVVHQSGAFTAIAVVSGITAAVATLCLANPKACFGSCPTFYANSADGELLQAEGFSASIAPALEATDLDALWRAKPTGRDFAIRVTNEALETHVIRYADLLAVPRPAGTRVLLDDQGAFHITRPIAAPTRCEARDGDCRDALRAFDGVERKSPADSSDLASRETIELEFSAPPDGEVGLALAARQSLMTTYLLYQSLAWFGKQAVPALVSLASKDSATRAGLMGPARVLGRIEVYVPGTNDEWVLAGEMGETGPIATDVKVVPLPRRVDGGTVQRVRLKMTRGLWRLDWAHLVELGSTVKPTRLKPGRVQRSGKSDSTALAALTLRKQPLTTFPGDEYSLHYRLPERPEALELFLETRGYYLEWMRQEWLAEENPLRAAQVVLNPAGVLRALAPSYVVQEAAMDQLFWNSRYVKH